jgi:nucleoid-associated protein Lsr2
MATKTLTTDDLDGSENATAVRFALGDTTYEVDLAQANRDKLEKALAPFIQVAREVVRRSAPNGQSAVIREWAIAKGLTVPAKGRIPGEITARYEAEQASYSGGPR